MSFLFLLFIAAGVGAHWHGAYYHSDDDFSTSADNPKWMAKLDGNRRLNTLSIPGTHDSCGLYGGDIPQTQAVSIRRQLDAGIRFLDIRLRPTNNKFAIHHGIVFEELMFGDVLNSVVAFLRENGGETVLMRVKEEYEPETGSLPFNEIFRGYAEESKSIWWQPTGTNPTLAEIRGKIVFLQNFNDNGDTAELGAYGLKYPGNFDIQDDYHLTWNWNLYSKWIKVKKQLAAAGEAGKSGKDHNAYINYLTGSGGSMPYFVASGHSSPQTGAPRLWTGATSVLNPYPDFPKWACVLGACLIDYEGTNILTDTYIEDHHPNYVGIVVADFPGQQLIQRVLSVN